MKDGNNPRLAHLDEAAKAWIATGSLLTSSTIRYTLYNILNNSMDQTAAEPEKTDVVHVSIREAFWTWCRVAALSFGGPAGQISVVGVILNLAVWFSLHTLFQKVESWQGTGSGCSCRNGQVSTLQRAVSQFSRCC